MIMLKSMTRLKFPKINFVPEIKTYSSPQQRSPKVAPLVVVKPAMHASTENQMANITVSTINRLCQFAFPMIALLFTVGYFTVVASKRA